MCVTADMTECLSQYEAEEGGLELRASHNYGFQASVGSEALCQNKHDPHISSLIMWVSFKLAFLVLCHLVAHPQTGWLNTCTIGDLGFFRPVIVIFKQEFTAHESTCKGGSIEPLHYKLKKKDLVLSS